MPIDQSSQLAKARELRDAYETEHERDAFEAGYDHAHGIACHNVPRIGESYWTEDAGNVTPEDEDEARDLHESLCYAAESNSRCFSPWEYTAAKINALEEFDAEAAWEAYDAGVAAAIAHDLEGYTAEDYGAEDSDA